MVMLLPTSILLDLAHNAKTSLIPIAQLRSFASNAHDPHSCPALNAAALLIPDVGVPQTLNANYQLIPMRTLPSYANNAVPPIEGLPSPSS
jgi:hypothetical protein